VNARPILLSIVMLALTACHTGDENSPSDAREHLDAKLEPRTVHLIVPDIREERPSVDLVGEIRAFDTVQISPEVAGRVASVEVEVGDRVSKDRPLVVIDPRPFELRLRQAEARVSAARADLELARRELERKQDLVSDKTIPQAVFDQAQARHDLAAATLSEAVASRDLADRDLELTTVRAPADGTVTARIVVAGQWTDVGAPLVEIALGRRVKVVARVPSHWVTALQGLEGFDFTVQPGESPRRALLYSIDPVVSETSRSFEVVGVAPAAGLKPGLFANIRLDSPETVRTLWIPASALLTSDTPKVYQPRDGRIAVKRVQTGRRADGMIEIVEGLEEGEAVISDVAGLSRDLPVEVVE